jgi:hypothetical protein
MYQEYVNPVGVEPIDDAMSLLVDHFTQVFAIGLWNGSPLLRELKEELNSLEEPEQPVLGSLRPILGDIVERGFGLLERARGPLDSH